MLSIVLTGYSRPHYMQRTLASWSRVRGVDAARFSFCLEPGYPEVLDLCSGVSFAEARVQVNQQRLGVRRNPFNGLSAAFYEGSRFVILAEDDLVVGADVLEFFADSARRYAGDRDVLAVSAFRHRAPLLATLDGVVRGRGFPGQVWGTWSDRWERLIAPEWFSGPGWDLRLEALCAERGYETVTPALSRSQHIGQEGGTYMSPGVFDQIRSWCFVADAPPQAYREAEDLAACRAAAR